MHLEALSIFCDVVRHQSFSRGALAHSVSQSAASQAVRQIEKRLGARLIDRSTRPWRLTTEGKLFFEGCQEIVERYQSLETEVRQLQQPHAYTVRLASIYSVRLHDLSEYVDRFRRQVPGRRRPRRVHAPRRGLRARARRSLRPGAHLVRDAATRSQRGARGSHSGWSWPVVRATAWPDRAGQAEIAPRELSGQRFVAFDRGLPVRREIDRFLRRARADVEVVAEFDNIENIKQAVEDGDGVALLPEPTLRREVEGGTLIAVRFASSSDGAPFVRPVSIIHRRRRHLNRSVVEFIALLRSGHPAGAEREADAPTLEATS